MLKKKKQNRLVIALSVLTIAIILPATVILSLNKTNYKQDAAMKMPMSPTPSQMPGNNNTVTVLIVHKGMSMNGGNGSGMTAMVEESDSNVDSVMISDMQMGNGGKSNGNMCGNTHDMFFIPKVVTISVETTVKWINKDPGMKHTSTSIKRHGAETWDSGNLKNGDSFEHTFTHTGVYPYDCDIHPWMRGVVKVVDNMSPMSPTGPMPSKMPKPSRMPMTPVPSM